MHIPFVRAHEAPVGNHAKTGSGHAHDGSRDNRGEIAGERFTTFAQFSKQLHPGCQSFDPANSDRNIWYGSFLALKTA